jgi:hypothetical protein
MDLTTLRKKVFAGALNETAARLYALLYSLMKSYDSLQSQQPSTTLV